MLMHCIRRAVSAALLVAAVGCGLVPRLPAVEPGTARELLEPGSVTCSGRRCRANVRVGESALRVLTDARLRSPEEATGRPRPSAVRRATSAIGGVVLRGVGVTTVSTVVGVGTRQVNGADSAMRLSCRLAWVDEEARSRSNGDDSLDITRRAEGMRCDALAAGDSTHPLWRFILGVSPERDSLALVLDDLDARGQDGPFAPHIRLEEVPFDAPPRRYTIEGGPVQGSGLVPVERWIVRRPDGVQVAAILQSVRRAVDFSAVATPEERGVIRLVAAALSQPLVAH